VSESSVAAVILAAGFSRRLGRAKQTVVLGGETLVERAVRVARVAGLTSVIVVVNPEGDFGHSLQQQGCMVAINREAAEGIAASIRSGVSAARALHVSGVVLMTCDQISVRPEHLQGLMAEREIPSGSAYAGRIGIPAYFPASSFVALLELEGDTGARELLRNARSVPTEDLAFDVDTEEDVVRAEKLIASEDME
jgi:molybdenum cofactor cytidylyltransferase